MISVITRSSHSSKLASSVSVLLALVLFASPLCAQRPSPPRPGQTRTAPRLNEIAIEALLAEDSYKVVGEVRNIGQLMNTGGGAGEIIEPIMKLADPPNEFRELIKFLNANTEVLSTARLMFATSPARPDIPNAFVAIELPSAAEAEKFEPKLNRLLPIILPTPTPTPTPSPTPVPMVNPAASPPGYIPSVRKGVATVGEPSATLSVPVVVAPSPSTPQTNQKRANQPPPPPPGPPFVVTRTGNLIFVTDKPFKFDQLRPANSKLLSEDQNFRVAHDRFATDPVFIYVNVELEDRSRPKPPPVTEISAEEMARIKAGDTDGDDDTEKEVAKPGETTPPQPEETPQPEDPRMGTEPTLVAELPAPEDTPAPTPNPSQQLQMAAYSQFGTLFNLLASGESEWPDAVGIGVSQETDSYVVRAILLGPANARRLVVPFVPQLIAGRGFTSNAPSVLPDDTEIFISASLDFSKSYDAMLIQSEKLRAQELAERRVLASQRESSEEKEENEKKAKEPFFEFEKKGGFKIKDEFLPAFGDEVAIAGSLTALQGFDPIGIAPRPPRTPSPSPEPGKVDEAAQAKKKHEEESSPMILVAVKDREAARRLMPRVLDGLGVGEANMVGRPERREDTEMVDFAGAFAYAFVGDFVVISTTPTVRHVVDSYVNHATLSSNNSFRNFSRWEPREALGQIYVSPALMDSYQKSAHDPSVPMASAMREFLMRLSPAPQSITYAMSNEGFGAIHELHLPKTFVIAMVAGTASATTETPPEVNEEIAIGVLRSIAGAEETYKATEGKGSYGSLSDLSKQGLLSLDMVQKYGYTIQLSASGDHFEVNATPIEYGKTGRRSFVVDQSGVVRGDDHLGGPATAADKPAQ